MTPEEAWRDYDRRTRALLGELDEVTAQSTLADAAADRAVAVRAVAAAGKILRDRVDVAQGLGIVHREPARQRVEILAITADARALEIQSRADAALRRIAELGEEPPALDVIDIYGGQEEEGPDDDALGAADDRGDDPA